MLGVASIDEALVLRRIGLTTPILLAQGMFSSQEGPEPMVWMWWCIHTEQMEWMTSLAGMRQSVRVWYKDQHGDGQTGLCARCWVYSKSYRSIAKPSPCPQRCGDYVSFFLQRCAQS